MDLSQMKKRPQGVVISGNWTRVLVALEDDFAVKPTRDAGNEHQISQNFVFKPGKAWNAMYSTQKTTNLDEKGSEQPDNDAATSVFKLKVAGFDAIRREFVTKHQKDNFIILIQKCGQDYPIAFGDSCSYCKISWAYAEGTNAGDESAVEITFTREGAFPAAIYKGAVSNNNIFAADDVTPSVADGMNFMTNDNTAPTAITNLDNAVVGATYLILGGGGANASIIADGGNFSLVGGATWTATAGTYIRLFCRGANDFVELDRG